jgi:hypothetical protein
MHLCSLSILCSLGGAVGCTSGPLFLDVALQDPVERFTGHLTGEHESDLNLAVAPYQRRVDYTESLGNEGQPCTQV